MWWAINPWERYFDLLCYDHNTWENTKGVQTLSKCRNKMSIWANNYIGCDVLILSRLFLHWSFFAVCNLSLWYFNQYSVFLVAITLWRASRHIHKTLLASILSHCRHHQHKQWHKNCISIISLATCFIFTAINKIVILC